MRTFEEQRREFIELALKLIDIDRTKYKSCCVYGNLVDLHYIENKVQRCYSIINTPENNETEIQKLRDLVKELG